MTANTTQARIDALTPEKQRLLALRLGVNVELSTQVPASMQLAAFVTSRSSMIIDTDDLRGVLRNKLPQYMIPASITVVDTFPRTPNGKVDRDRLIALREKSQAMPTVQTESEAPNEVETQLRSLWEELLGFEILDIDDDFFALGGYSLLAIRMLARIKEMFDVELPPSIIMESPSIRELAKRINADGDAISAQAIFTLQPKGDLPPLYCFQVHKFGVITYRYVAQHLGKDRPIYGLSMPQEVEETPNTIEGLAEVFVKSLLAQQTEGPYLLCGMSIAGLLAYEAARQLKQRGIDDVHVIFFDTYGPTYPQMLSTSEAIQEKLAHHLTMLTDSQTDHPTYLKELFWRNWYRAKYQLGKVSNRYRTRLGIAPPESKIEDEATRASRAEGAPVREFAGQKVYGELIELLDLEEAYFSNPKPYDGDILLYRATLQPVRASYNETLGWENFVTGNINVRHMRGTHSGMLRYPYIENLADQLRSDLRQLEEISS